MIIEHRPLLSLFATGKIAPVDAAALGSVPADLLARANVSRDEVIQDRYALIAGRRPGGRCRFPPRPASPSPGGR